MATPNEVNKNYVDCSNCAMNPVCQPIEANNQSLTLAQSYLDKRIATAATKILFSKDENTSAIYAVCSGVFKLCEYTQDDQKETALEKIIGFRFPGELLGEDALFPEKYNYRAIAIGESSVCKVAIEEMNFCSNLVPQLQNNLIQLLSKQSYLRQRDFQALIGKKSAESLLAAFLLNIAERNAAHFGSETVLHLSISRNDIANFLGLRRETLSRVFSKFQKDQLISIQGKKIELLATEQLNNLT